MKDNTYVVPLLVQAKEEFLKNTNLTFPSILAMEKFKPLSKED
jgi:hypothetical protein